VANGSGVSRLGLRCTGGADPANIGQLVECLPDAPVQGLVLSAEAREAIEAHAMRAAIAYFEEQGDTVEDVSKSKPFDLLCTRERERLFVEVKGTQTEGIDVRLTPGEVRFALNNADSMVLFVVHSVVCTNGSAAVRTSGGLSHVVQPWRIDEALLVPLGYSYPVPRQRQAHRSCAAAPIRSTASMGITL